MLSEVKGTDTYLSGISYYASAKIKQMTYGNGVQTDYDYYDTDAEQDPSAMLKNSQRLRRIKVSKGATGLLDLSYEYDPAGNVKLKKDANNLNYTERYGYDELDRL